jgi:hypothetical protein
MASGARLAGPVQFVFPGATGNYLSVSDAANLNIAGDIEIVARCALSDWTPAAINVIANKDQSSGSAVRSWIFRLTSTGALQLILSVDGTALLPAIGSVLPAVDGTALWVKATRVAATGLVSFYSAADAPTEPSSWTARGTASPGAGNMTNGTSPLVIGARSSGGLLEPLAGRIMRVIVRNGIAGTTVLDVSEANATDPSAPTFPSSDTGVRYVYFPAVAGNYLSLDSPNLAMPGDDEIVARLEFRGTGAVGQIIGSDGSPRGWSLVWNNLRLRLTYVLPSVFSESADIVGPAVGSMIWIRVRRTAADGVCTFEWAVDSPTEPTTWVNLTVASGPTTPGAFPTMTSTQTFIGARTAGGINNLLRGRVARLIVRNGIGGPAVLDFDAAANLNGVDPIAPIFTLTTGGTVTVNRSGTSATELVTGSYRVTETGDVIKAA